MAPGTSVAYATASGQLGESSLPYGDRAPHVCHTDGRGVPDRGVRHVPLADVIGVLGQQLADNPAGLFHLLAGDIKMRHQPHGGGILG